jgi:hypothetical protein
MTDNSVKALRVRTENLKGDYLCSDVKRRLRRAIELRRLPGNVLLCRAITSSGTNKGDAMNGEPKKQEPEILPPVPEVEPERNVPEIPPDKNVPEIPPDKDAPEKKGPIRSEG